MIRLLFSFTVLLIFPYSLVFASTEVVILSANVGTEIDIHENRFYRIFPKEKGFVNAQIIKLEKDSYKITIVKESKGDRFKVIRFLDQKKFQKLKDQVDSQKLFTVNEKIAMYEGMEFLRAEKIIQGIPKPQFIVLKHSGKKKLKGTLLNFEKKMLHIQTPSRIEKISLQSLDQISYRNSIGRYDQYRNHFYVINALFGLSLAEIYNKQRPVIFNEYNVARSDIFYYRYITGIILGLIFSSEVFDALSTLFTSSDTIILSEAEYEEQNYK